MYYIIYKTTNIVNGKIYIGCHKTSVIEDGYIGSGKILKRAIKKYGKECFEREVLDIFNNPDDMFTMETTLVNDSFVSDPNTYNLCVGGSGGSKIFGDHHTHSPEHMAMIQQASKDSWNDPEVATKRGKAISERLKQQYASGKRTAKCIPHIAGEYVHSDESKQKISEAKKGKGIGSTNSNAKPVEDADGIIFPTLKDCANHHQISTRTVSNRIKNGIFKFI